MHIYSKAAPDVLQVNWSTWHWRIRIKSGCLISSSPMNGKDTFITSSSPTSTSASSPTAKSSTASGNGAGPCCPVVTSRTVEREICQKRESLQKWARTSILNVIWETSSLFQSYKVVVNISESRRHRLAKDTSRIHPNVDGPDIKKLLIIILVV